MAYPELAAAQAASAVNRLAWLSGCWEASSASQVIEEHWTEPRGNSMLGMNRTIRDGSLASYELVIIREDEDGLVFEAHPSGQAIAYFPARLVSDTLAVFENPEHDFPQRISYALNGADSLLAWIEGESGGAMRRIDFGYRRVLCPGR
jgi:hypothetical protein